MDPVMSRRRAPRSSFSDSFRLGQAVTSRRHPQSKHVSAKPLALHQVDEACPHGRHTAHLPEVLS
jgi:hypothetical protein